MGTWGPAIFSDDAASDLRSDYKEILASGVSDEEALERVLTDYADDFVDADVGPGLRIALALTLHKVGRLPDEIRDRALAAIEAGSDERWDSPALIKARATALDASKPVPDYAPWSWRLRRAVLRPLPVGLVTALGRLKNRVLRSS